MKSTTTITLIMLALSAMVVAHCAAQAPDSIRPSEFVLLPATAYTPETSLTLGGVSQYYFDFARDTQARMSFVQVGAIYTLRQQMYFGGELNLISPGEEYMAYVNVKYSDFNDRDYGLGNDAAALVYQWRGGQLDSLNYLDFSYQSFGVELQGMRKVANGLYSGLHYRYEKLWDYGRVADSLLIHKTDAGRDEFAPAYLSGTRSGVSWLLTYDNRKSFNSPLRGTFVQFRNGLYASWMGSDYEYASISLDARHYIQVHKEQTLALRFLNEQRYPIDHSIVPKFDLARVGGRNFARGYYDGTYADYHLTAFELEYRMPLWQDPQSRIWHFWKRMGLVAFASGARVYQGWEGFALSGMRFALGSGLRFLLSPEQRLNARLDIGYGLHPQSDFDRRNIGVYIYISEAF